MPVEMLSDQVTLARLVDGPPFGQDLDALGLNGAAKIVLDFSDVRHINSSGLARLLRLRQRLVEDGSMLVLCTLSPQVLSVFQVTGLDKIFNIAGSRDEALQLVRS